MFCGWLQSGVNREPSEGERVICMAHVRANAGILANAFNYALVVEIDMLTEWVDPRSHGKGMWLAPAIVEGNSQA